MGRGEGPDSDRAVGMSRGRPSDELDRPPRPVEVRDPRHRHGDSAAALTEALEVDVWFDLQILPVPIIVAGTEAKGANLDGLPLPVRRVKVEGLRLVLRDPPFVAVLGDEALRRLSPSVVGPLLRQPGCPSFACARDCPPAVVADWARRCPIEFVPEGSLRRRVARACRTAPARRAESESPRSASDREKMRKALHVLRQAGDFQVKSWARALGPSRHALGRLCRATLGLTPGEIAWTFFHARVMREITLGRTDARIAAAVGVATAWVLRRAYSRRGLPFPR